MMNWIIDQIPWWVWLVLTVGIVGGLMAFFYPVLLPIWNLTPKPIKIALGAIGAGLLTYFAGRNKGHKDFQQKMEKDNAKAVETRSQIDQDVRNRSPTQLDRDLDKWMRP